MATDNKREIALEQAAVALLSEAAKAGVDLAAIAEKAKAGVIGNAMYTWVSDSSLKSESCSAINYLLQRSQQVPAE